MERRHINVLISMEIQSAAELHGPMQSSHEAFAVILEELDEYWEQVKLRQGGSDQAVKELVQIAASAIRALMDTVKMVHS